MFLLVKEVSLFLKLSVSVTGLLLPPELLVSLLFCLWVAARERCLGRDSLSRDLDWPSFRLGVFRFIRLRFDLALKEKEDITKLDILKLVLRPGECFDCLSSLFCEVFVLVLVTRVPARDT